MGGFTVDQNFEMDVYVDDIIDNIDQFDNDELLELKEEIEFRLNKISKSEQDVLVASTLDEEYKIKILREMFDKFSWSELEDIKKKIM